MPGYKRKRGSAPMDSEARQALQATKARGTLFTIKSGRSGEKKRITSSSVRRKRARGPLTTGEITNILCPIFSYKRIGYGNSWFSRAWNHLQATYPDRTGTVKSLNWTANTQAWQEFIGLPMHNYGGQSGTGSTAQSFTYDGFHASISQLIAKAADVRNDVQNTWISRPQETIDMISPAQDATQNTSYGFKWAGLQFDYHGGYQQHTFTNTSECNVTIYLQELKPREVMTGVEEDLDSAGDNFRVRSVGTDLLIDYKNDLPMGNTLRPTYSTGANAYVNASTDSVYDPMVRINKHSNLVHRRYLVGQEFKVTLKPGDGYTHRMVFEPFSFTESTWNTITSQLSDLTSASAGTANATPPVMLVPMFTKILVVRAQSELGFASSAGYISAVGKLPGAVAHTCTEQHSCRMLPLQKPFNMFVDYTLSGTVDQIMEGQSSANVDTLAATGLAN